MIKNILVSVSDKSGLIEFLTPLYESGAKIISTGGTARFLKENGIANLDISEQTGFPEVMGGRVKTLHPHVHMALLGRQDHMEDMNTLAKYNLELFDLVVVNLYPFEEAVKNKAPFNELIEKIDVGGPTMLRAAAKNHSSVAVVCDPSDYSWIQEKKYQLTPTDRKFLAARVFSHTAAYDSMISKEFQSGIDHPGALAKLELSHTLAGKLVQPLRYGENPHQAARWYRWYGPNNGLGSAQILQGKELSYNNILDLDAAIQLLQCLSGPSCVAVKHNNPCGAATDQNLTGAVKKCLKADPLSVFGGIVAVNREITELEATLFSEIFLECVIAPKISEEAQKIFQKKKNLRILEWPEIMSCKKEFDLKSVVGGFLVQDSDQFTDPKNWIYKGNTPSSQIQRDLVFGERVCSVLKSNAIAIVHEGQTIGLGMGQVNRVDAVEQAIKRMLHFHPLAKDPVLISDAFFPFPDSIEYAAKAGIKWILQPGGSVKDQEIFAVAENLGVNIIISGQRHFRH